MTPPVRLSVALVVATAAACIVPGVGPVAASVLPHVAIVALVMTVGAASGWLTDRRAAAVLGDGLWGVLNRIASLGLLLLPSAPTGTLGLLDGLHPWAVVVVYLVVIDVAVSVSHAWMHRDARLWPIHEVHHHPTVWQPTLYGRGHILEGVRSAVAVAVAGWLLGGDRSALWVLGLVFPVSGYLAHLPWRLPVGPLAYVIVTPQYHAIHHSADPRHHDRNFGGVTTLPDLLMGTACWDFDAVREYGTGEHPTWEADRPTVAAAVRAWWGGLWHPVRRWFGMMSPQHPAPELRDVRG